MTEPDEARSHAIWADIDQLRREQYELKEKLLTLRESELLPLKEKVNDFVTKSKIFSTIGSIVLVILGLFGVNQYRDLNALINKTFTKKLDEKLAYHDKLIRAITLANTDCRKAIPLLIDLAESNPDDELALMHLMGCYIDVEDYDGGFRLYQELKERKLFASHFQLLPTFNNAGKILLVRALQHPELLPEAYTLLKRAEQIGLVENSLDLRHPLYNLMMYYIATRELSKAKVYAERLNEAIGNDQFMKVLNETGIRYDRELLKRLQHRAPDEFKEGFKGLVLSLLEKQ